MDTINWSDIRSEYVTTNISYRQLADKYGIPRRTVYHRGKTEKWVQLREQHRSNVDAAISDAAVAKEVSKYERVVSAADRLLEKIEMAINELDKHIVTHKTRERVIEYSNMERPDKPTKEIIKDDERIEAIESIINRDGIKALAQALMAVKDIQSLKSERDIEEQQARIDKLRKDAEADEVQNKHVTVQIDVPEEWCE